MNLWFLQPRAELKPCIQSIWVFESDRGLPVSDLSMAAPNGCPKLVVNLENSLISSAQGQAHETREQSLSFIGVRSLPVMLSTPAGKTSFVGIEFMPTGAFPILGIPMAELADRLIPADNLSGFLNASVTDRIWNREGIKEKVDLIQAQLLDAASRGHARNLHTLSPIVEFCVDHLRRTNGAATISDLEARTGYSRRFLEILFKRYVGVSPKTLAGIFRFQWFYGKMARGKSYDAVKEDLYDLFYDQSHFRNEFRKMTGFSPRNYSRNVRNEFGRRVALAHTS